MDLLLWRHADAVDGVSDLARELTPKGHRQAADVGKWLRSRLPKGTLVLVSPAARAQQTAQALTSEFKSVGELSPGASPEAVLAAAGWPKHSGTVVVVGHQPTLGQAAALLLSGEAVEWSIKKGGVWWITRRTRGDHVEVLLRAVMSPDLV
jgi:phosphohistidine phosphatase